VIINPNNVEEIADALKEALEIPEAEQIRRNKILRSRIKNCDVVRWADDFIYALLAVKEEQVRLRTRTLDSSACEDLMNKYRSSKRRLLLLDYDGTLVPFNEDPQLAKPGKRLLKALKMLSDDAHNHVVLVSGRDKDTLQRWFGNLNINLVAEHGAWVRRTEDNWRTLRPLSAGWMPQILPIMKRYAHRLPGSFVEKKE